jgi:hypothetical protein
MWVQLPNSGTFYNLDSFASLEIDYSKAAEGRFDVVGRFDELSYVLIASLGSGEQAMELVTSLGRDLYAKKLSEYLQTPILFDEEKASVTRPSDDDVTVWGLTYDVSWRQIKSVLGAIAARCEAEGYDGRDLRPEIEKALRNVQR